MRKGEHVNTVAVFRWKGRLPSDEEVGADPATRYSGDFGEQWVYQACQPVAVAVLEAIRTLGHATDVDTPYFGEHGWHFTVTLGQENYWIMVLWILRGNKNDDKDAQQTPAPHRRPETGGMPGRIAGHQRGCCFPAPAGHSVCHL